MFTKEFRRPLALILGLAAILFFTAAGARAQAVSDSTPRGAEAINVQTVDPEIVAVAKTFGKFSPTEFVRWLHTNQPQAKPVTHRQSALIASNIERLRISAIADGDGLFHLSERTRPILELFRRDQVVQYLVIRESVPCIHVLYENVLVVTTGLLEALKSDEELNAMVAHELAHELSNEAYEKAEEAGDKQALRIYEAQCDAIAALALRAAGMDPRALGRILFRIVTANRENLKVNDGTTEHPALASRLRLNEEMATAFAVQARTEARELRARQEGGDIRPRKVEQ